ncbi:hypothetical protein Ancab_008870 [Ancistrocladus abbreviatus]
MMISQHLKMEEKEVHQTGGGKQTKQQITVPFLWEEKPGMPKKDWKPKAMPRTQAPPIPTKFVVSIPFKWEEKPGTPLRCFQQGSSESKFQPEAAESKCLPPPPAYYPSYEDNDGDGGSSFGGDGLGGDDDDDYDDEDWKSEIELETISTDTGDSFSSAPSLLDTEGAAENTCQMEDNGGQIEAPSSLESGGSMSSYVTGSTSLVGASFLEHLFPLYSPRSGLLKKTTHPDQKVGHSRKKLTPEQWHRDFHGASNRSIKMRRPLTLGELIMLSQRRSCRRKAVHMRKQSHSKDIIEKKAIGCCMFGAANRVIDKLLAKKSLLSLKLA